MSEKTNIPFLLYEVKNHLEIKNKILNTINEMGCYSYINKNQQISNSDWQLTRDFKRPYLEFVLNIFKDVVFYVNEKFEYTEEPVQVINYWFQQYNYGDYHTWHKHSDGILSCVYYVNLTDDNSKTSFKLFDKEFEIEVKEGTVLIFPSFLNHCSKPNKSKNKKTVISFNLN